jgi:Holliday junction resolvasome RuvABC DNA-binding subunit
MCVELRDRLPKAIVASDAAPSPGDALRDDLVSALINLGYHRQAIDKSLDKLVTNAGEQRFEDVLRSALKDLSRA